MILNIRPTSIKYQIETSVQKQSYKNSEYHY